MNRSLSESNLKINTYEKEQCFLIENNKLVEQVGKLHRDNCLLKNQNNKSYTRSHIRKFL